MKVAVMQPYLFPYLGYYQLVNSVDRFVFYDNVNFIKGGYINRNSILANDLPLRFTWPVEKQSSFTHINELNFVANTRKVLKTIEQNYIKAPYFSDVFPLIRSCFQPESLNVASVTANSVSRVFHYLGIEKEFMFASQLSYDTKMSAEEKLFAICKLLDADVYINAKGGKKLYSKSAFLSKHIELSFIEPKLVEYNQGIGEFIPHLSIIDVLMWNSKASVVKLLSDYRLT